MTAPPNGSRIPLVGDDSDDPVVRRFFQEIRDKGGEPLNLHRTLANAPALMTSSRATAYAIRYDATVPRALRELAIIRSAQLNGGHYEEMQHRPMALACGLSERQLDEIGQWGASASFDAPQRAVLAFVDGISRVDGPTDAEFAAVSRFLSHREIVELTFIAANYAGMAMFTRALRTPLEPGAGNPDNRYGKD